MRRRDIEEVVERDTVRRRWARRGRRRALVAAGTAVTLAAGTAAYLMPALSAAAGLPVLLALLALVMVLGTQVNIAARWVVGLRLDERQRADQERARQIGHHVTSAALVVAVTVAFGLLYNDAGIPSRLVAPVVWLVTMLHVGFPASYLAWTAPDEVTDDEDDDPTPA